MSNDRIHIYEENINLFWGMLGLVAIAAGAYFLADAFFAGSWQWMGAKQISSLFLFAIGFYAIIQLTEPLYQFELYIDQQILHIEIWEGSDTHHATKKIELNTITELKVIPHTPRRDNEALFDYSSNYHLLYKTNGLEVYKDLVDLDRQSFTLKLKDIQKVIRFIHNHNPKIGIDDQALMQR